VREGIPLAQAVLSCHSEKQQCIAEQRNLCQWISHEITATHALYASSLSEDVDVAFLALMKLHELYKLLKAWEVIGVFGENEAGGVWWPVFKCPTHIEDFPQLKEVKEQAGHGLGCLLGLNCQRASDASEGSDSCISSDDEEDGALEEDIDAEDLLAEPNEPSE